MTVTKWSWTTITIPGIFVDGFAESAIDSKLTLVGLPKMNGKKLVDDMRSKLTQLQTTKQTNLTIFITSSGSKILTTPTEHYIPSKEDCPNVAQDLENMLTVPVIRLGKVRKFDANNPPFDVVGTSWEWPNFNGPFTKGQFMLDLTGAVKNLANFIDERGECKAYPMSWKPKTVEGVGYIDFETMKIDVRLVGRYGFLTDHDDYGLSFHVVTLLGKDKNAT
jgi:hypothetical protein